MASEAGLIRRSYIQPLESLKPARNELEHARAQIVKLNQAKNATEAIQAWYEYLRVLERVWNKTKDAMRLRPKWQGWTGRGQIEQMRDNDPLLAYLSNARGVLEHGVAEVAREAPGSVTINPASGNSLTIERMTVMRAGISIKSPDPIKVTFTPASLVLADVTNRGRKYPVPKSHVGRDLQSTDPVALAELGVSFYDGALKVIDEEFGRQLGQ